MVGIYKFNKVNSIIVVFIISVAKTRSYDKIWRLVLDNLVTKFHIFNVGFSGIEKN